MESRTLVHESMEKMDVAALLTLGRIYAGGFGVTQNHEMAFRAYQIAAQKGELKAASRMGDAYFKGLGVAKDYDAAYRVMHGIEDDNLRAYCFCRRYYPEGKLVLPALKEEVREIQQEAEKGDLHAIAVVGKCYYHGYAGYIDYETAFSWLRKAAQSGHATAQFYVGFAYVTGCGVKRDCREGKAWFEKAAQQGFIPAVYNLARCCANGYGMLPDLKKAAGLQKQAAEAGVQLDNCIRFYTPSDLRADSRFHQSQQGDEALTQSPLP